MYNFFQTKIFWKKLLIAVAEMKMRAMLEHYDYFGLYTTARNFICVHSELNLRSSHVKMMKIENNGHKLNFFFKEFKNFLKSLTYNSKKIKKIPTISFYKLERELFESFFKPFCTKNFEKTDTLHRFLFLDKYLIYRKLLPNSK